MFASEDKVLDPLEDEIGGPLKQLVARATWGHTQQELRAALMRYLKRRNYTEFVGHPARYHVTIGGDSCLYDVPLSRRGHLKVFRGQRIRLVCVRSGRFSRGYMAGAFGDPQA